MCSYAGFQGGDPDAAVNELHRVALHAIPTQSKPGQVLTEGEREPVRVVAMKQGSSVQQGAPFTFLVGQKRLAGGNAYSCTG